MRGCTGAGSTQARTVTCMSPPFRWRSTLASTFKGFGFSRTLIALVSSYVFCTCLDQAGARFGLGLARGRLCLLRLDVAWRPSSLEPVGPVQTTRVQGLGLDLARGLSFSSDEAGWPPILNKWTGL